MKAYSEKDLEILAKTIYGEARGELYRYGIASLIAVANVVANRVEKNFAATVRDVCLAPNQFSCWNANDPNFQKLKSLTTDCSIFRKCLEVAENVLEGKWPDLTDGCDHYHSRDVKPYWAAHLEPKRIFGRHYFYNLKDRK
ncbi:MAG: cell wall hydrolase [Holosporaceae bacterium]|jgi:spore germination cell wall hydrolase CwlJ-like protein|nr:cell wall hydrolase [Holosporaceae bacterium]